MARILPEAGVPAVLWESDNLGSRFWDELLTECLELSRAEQAIAAFAVDGQGLCIAQVGDMAPDAVEGTGSRRVRSWRNTSQNRAPVDTNRHLRACIARG